MTREVYDWVGDDSLDLDATLRHLRALEPGQVVTEWTFEESSDATDSARLTNQNATPDAGTGLLFAELQRRVESSTREVLNEATALRDSERRLSYLSTSIVSVVTLLVAVIMLLSNVLDLETYITGAIVGLAGVTLGVMLYKSAASARSLRASLYGEAGREIRVLQLMSITLLIKDSERRDRTIAALAERLVDDDFLGEDPQTEIGKRPQGISGMNASASDA